MKRRHITINVMGSLLVGDPFNPDSAASQDARAKYIREIKEMKRLGVRAVSIDFWWGLLQPEEGPVDWTKPGPAYYDWCVNTAIEHGLKVIPIMSYHQCGGNVGDDVYVPIPKWVWEKLARLLGDANIAKFKSEQGNFCDEVVGFLATHLIVDDMMAVLTSVRDHFADRKEHIAEINVSLGPAGELRYPSYNSHDKDVDYPTRGALQCYAKLFVEDFQAFMLARYGDAAGIDRAWGTNIAGGQPLLPPSNPAQFFAGNDHLDTQYGRDFFDWYSGIPLRHARLVIKRVFDVLAADDSPMKGIDIGFKVPGIHWLTGKWEFDAQVTARLLGAELAELVDEHGKAGASRKDATAYGAELAAKLATHVRRRTANWVPVRDGGVLKVGSRLAELAAGLIRTSDAADWQSDDAGRGYRQLISMFAEYAKHPNSRLVLHFTCLEMADGEGADKNANSVACSLVQWFGAEATRQGVPLKGENAVWWSLPERAAWERMRKHLIRQEDEGTSEEKPVGGPTSQITGHPNFVSTPYFEGLTVLRMSHVSEFPVASEEMAKTISYVGDSEAVTVVTPSEPETTAAELEAVSSEAATEGGDDREGSQGPPATEKVA